MRKNYYKKIIFGLLIIVLLISPLGGHFAFAQTGDGVCAAPNWFTAGLCGIARTFIVLPLALGGFVLYVSGVFLNAVLLFSVINMGETIQSMTGINIAWSIIRDLANITFIFILLYISIGTILGLQKVNWKKTLVAIVIAAVLINFSLFFTKVIIDTSNIVAIFFYQQINPSTASGGILTTGLSNSFMQPLGLTTFFNPINGGGLLETAGKSLSTLAAISAGGTILFLVTAFVFLAVSIMFLIRLVTFIFLLILSPVMVLGNVSPKIADKTGKWWKSLIDQATFAPVYMILTYVVLRVIQAPGFIVNASSTNNASAIADVFEGVASSQAGAAASQGGFDLLLNFGIVIALALGTLIISKQVSGQSGSAGEKFAGKVLGGTGGYLGRRTVGSYGRKLADSKELKDMAANKDGQYSRLQQMRAKGSLLAGQKIAKSSFDVRKPLAGGLKAAGVKGINVGKSQKGGYDQYIKDKTKKQTDFIKSLDTSGVEKDRVKQELEKARSAVPNAQREIDSIESNIEALKSDFANKPPARDRGTQEYMSTAFQAELKKLEEERDEKKAKLQAIKESSEENIARAQERADKILGVSEEEAIKRYAKEKGLGEKDVKNRVKSGEIKKDELGIVKSEGDQRKESYVKNIAEPGKISASRVGFVGKIKRQNLEAAAEARSKKPSAKDLIDQALKATGEAKDEGGGEEEKKDSDAGGDKTPPAGGAPTT